MKMRAPSSRASIYSAVLITVPMLAFFLTLLPSEGQSARKDSVNSAVSVTPPKKDAAPRGYARFLDSYIKLPLAFERNMGQADGRVKYLTHGSGYELFLTPKEAVLALWQPEPQFVAGQPSGKILHSSNGLRREASVLRLQLPGANPSAEIEPVNRLERKANYFTGNDHKNWVTDVPSYERVEYRGIYPGVDLAFYGNQRRLEYDFVVSPGADPKGVSLRLAGSKSLRINNDGNLIIGTPSGNISFQKPVIYQLNASGERQEVAGGYLLAKNEEVEFAISSYDRSRALVIDPVLDYSTYLGGSSIGDEGFGVAVDGNGNAFVTGLTFNASFPVTSSPATTVGPGVADANITANGGAFVSEIDPTGTKELYFDYLSGDGGEIGYSVAVDPTPNTTCMNGLVSGYCVYITGQTFSDNFPVNSVVTPYNNGTPATPLNGNAFVTKLNPYVNGNTSLLYSSYLASVSQGDAGHGIAVDSSQHAYITGTAVAGPGAVPNFPILNGAQSATPPAPGSAFLTVMNTTASTNALLYSTYLGGDDQNSGTNAIGSGLGDIGWAVAVDANKIAYIVGTTVSLDFPNIGSTATFPNIKGWQGFPALNTGGSAFAAAVNTTLSGVNSLVYSTYVGGNTADLGYGIALAGSGVVYITGQTSSSNFFTTQAGTSAGQFPSLPTTPGVAFVTGLNTSVSGQPTYSALLGGSSGDSGFGIQVDALGNVIVTGTTQSSDFPITPGAFKTALGLAVGDAFIAKINPAASGSAGLLYSTYFGGKGTTVGSNNFPDQGKGIALDSLGNVYITGQTYSLTDFPLSAGAFESSTPGGTLSAAYAAKLTLLPVLAFGSPCSFGLTVTPATSCLLDFGTQPFEVASAPQALTLTNNTGAAIALTIPLPALTGANAADFSAAPAVSGSTAACAASLAAGASCAIKATFTPSTSTAELAALTVTYTYNNGTGTPAPGSQTVALKGTGMAPPTVTLNPTPTLTFSSQPAGTTSAALPVTVNNTGAGNLVLTAAPAVSGTNASDFAIASGTTCTNGATVLPSASCTINITFTPGAAGARGPATLTVTDNAGTSPQTITITGTGVPAAPVASVSPLTVAFGNQLVTTTSAAQTVTVQNTGNVNLNITAAASFSGTNASDFAIASGTTCTNSAVVTPNSTCVINVTFTPPANGSGSRAAILNIADNAAGSPQAVTLTGTGTLPPPVANVSPSTVAFGNQLVTTTSAAQTVTVKNTGGSNLNIAAAVSFSGTNPSDFAVASGTTCTSGAVVTPNSTCVINVTFTPPANGTGSRATILSIADDAAGSPQAVSLTGTGTVAPPAASVLPATLTFTGQLVTTTSAAQTVTVKNTGGSNLNITAAPSLSGTNASDFAVATGTTCTNSAVVTPNSTCVINVTFTPPAGASGARSVVLNVADNASGSPQSVTLTATAWDFSLSAQSVTTNPGATATIAVTVTGVGGFTGAVTLSCSGTIPQGSCTAPSSAVTATGTGNVTVTTQSSLAPPASTPGAPLSMHQLVLMIFALMLLFALPVAQQFRTRMGLAGAAALLIVVAGCSGNSLAPTPAGTYPVTITGTSGNVSHAVTVNVVVN
jgi:hypothetical protein